MNRNIPFVDLGGENQEFKRDILTSIDQLIDSGYYILGENIDAFEREIKKKIASKYCLGLNSGGDALMLGIIALEFEKGTNIVVPSNSFIASAWAVKSAGLNLKFCDVSDDMTASYENFKDVSDNNTQAWMPVHLTGSPCNIDSFNQVDREKITIIEDAAQAFGTTYDDKNIGTWGEFGAFSLNPLKVLGVIGDGGFIVTNNENIFNKVKMLRNHGMQIRDDTSIWGFNSRLDEIQALIALIKLKKIDNNISKLRHLAKRYIDNLDKKIVIPSANYLHNSVWHRFVIFSEKRDELKEFLSSKGVSTAINYQIPLHLHPVSLALGYKRGDFPNTEYQAKVKLSLPLYPHLSIDDQDYIIENINNFYFNNF